jgi:hypothetical protein
MNVKFVYIIDVPLSVSIAGGTLKLRLISGLEI